MIQLIRIIAPLHGFDFGTGEAQYFPNFTQNRTLLEGHKRAQQSGVRVFIENKLGNIVSVLPGEVDIKIGW